VVRFCQQAGGQVRSDIRSQARNRAESATSNGRTWPHRFRFRYVLHPFAAKYSHWMWHSRNGWNSRQLSGDCVQQCGDRLPTADSVAVVRPSIYSTNAPITHIAFRGRADLLSTVPAAVMMPASALVTPAESQLAWRTN
jgi:hypothetical protein